MDIQAENFLILIRNIIHNDKLSLKEPSDPEKIFDIAIKNNLLPLTLESFYKTANKISVENLRKYEQKAMATVTAQSKRTTAFLKLYREFAKENIMPLVLKGIVCRGLYKEWCDHRPSSDEDILIRKNDFEKAKEVLEKAGYVCEFNDIASEMTEELQEVTFRNEKTRLTIELHLNPMGKDNDLRGTMNSFFEDAWDRSRETEINGTIIRTMGHTDHFLFLIFHAFRHFTAGGLGIRQILDILLYKDTFKSLIDMNYIAAALKKTRAQLFYNDIIYIGSNYLGFNESACLANYPEELLDDLFSSGVFGNTTQVHRSAAPMVSAAVSGRSSVIGAIFPSKKKLVNKYPVLEKRPWLLPCIWIKRMFTFVKHSKEQGGGLASKSIEHGNKRIELMRKYKIID